MIARIQGIFVACTQAAIFVRVVGRGACRNSNPLREFGQKKIREGYSRIVVDLSGCDGMDSTFLGAVAGLGLALHGPGSLSLLNLAGENLRAFNALGLEHIAAIALTTEPAANLPFPPDAEFQQLPGSDLTRKDRPFDAMERATLMLECHEYLCRIDTRNEEQFRDVKRFLREDIARHGGDRPSAH